MTPTPTPVDLDIQAMKHAWSVASGRHNTGGPSREPDSGFDPIRVDVVGAMAEIAICKLYGVDYTDQVKVEKNRPRGDLTDLRINGYKLGVKGRERFDNPMMVVPEYDDKCDLYFLCSVNPEEGYVEVRGYCTRNTLKQIEPEEWKWTNNRPGAKKKAKRRYVPLEMLTECRPPIDEEEEQTQLPEVKEDVEWPENMEDWDQWLMQQIEIVE